MKNIHRLCLSSLFLLVSGLAAATEPATIERALIILSSSSPQTQGMALVLGNTMRMQGTDISVLLCDQAGDLALKTEKGPSLKPKNVTPQQLLTKLQDQGASINVCALYLPNSSYSQADLRDGVTVATPPQMASMMRSSAVRVFSF